MDVEIERSFPAYYEIEIVTSRDRGDELIYFPQTRMRAGRKDDLLVRIKPERTSPWTGSFKREYDSDIGTSKVTTWPDPRYVCVLASGTGYLVDVDEPKRYRDIEYFPVSASIAVTRLGVIIFADLTRLIAYRKDGIAWVTGRLSWAGIEILDISERSIVGCGWDAAKEQKVEFAVDLRTGSHEGGASPFDE